MKKNIHARLKNKNVRISLVKIAPCAIENLRCRNKEGKWRHKYMRDWKIKTCGFLKGKPYHARLEFFLLFSLRVLGVLFWVLGVLFWVLGVFTRGFGCFVLGVLGVMFWVVWVLGVLARGFGCFVLGFGCFVLGFGCFSQGGLGCSVLQI